MEKKRNSGWPEDDQMVCPHLSASRYVDAPSLNTMVNSSFQSSFSGELGRSKITEASGQSVC
jgi:hypothetical protein